jgi:hypothetical protein
MISGQLPLLLLVRSNQSPSQLLIWLGSAALMMPQLLGRVSPPRLNTRNLGVKEAEHRTRGLVVWGGHWTSLKRPTRKQVGAAKLRREEESVNIDWQRRLRRSVLGAESQCQEPGLLQTSSIPVATKSTHLRQRSLCRRGRGNGRVDLLAHLD